MSCLSIKWSGKRSSGAESNGGGEKYDEPNVHMLQLIALCKKCGSVKAVWVGDGVLPGGF